jgi:EAL domain-containing protein (putative c-di-GMP-specific phosphodiesterase class I)
MTQDRGIIAFPVPAAAGSSAEQAPVAPAPVIDLQARRRAAVVKGNYAPRGHLLPLSSGEIWNAISEGRVVVHYQPQYDMQSGKPVAAEALVRLIDNDGQLVYPDRFIHLSEQRDLIVPLGRAVIERVCADLAACRAQGLPLRRIAVNLSVHQLSADFDLLGFIDRTVAGQGLGYDDLEFELTERDRLQTHCQGRDVLNTLAQRGARVVIDDFGVGYSSVVYLAELPVAAFKLDQTLVARALEDARARKLIDSLLALARTMGLDVVAEGVESGAHNDYLVAAGCPYAQGYGYARPMPIELLWQLIKTEAGSVVNARAKRNGPESV